MDKVIGRKNVNHRIVNAEPHGAILIQNEGALIRIVPRQPVGAR